MMISNWFGDKSITKVVLQGKYGLIDYYGKIVLPIEYDHIYEDKMYYEIEKDNLKGQYFSQGKCSCPHSTLPYTLHMGFYSAIL